MNNYNQHHKNLTGGSPKQSNIAGSFCPPIKKKMITEVLLILPLYLILFFIWWQFQHLIKIMADVGDILNDVTFLVMLLIHQRKILNSIKNENV